VGRELLTQDYSFFGGSGECHEGAVIVPLR